MNKELLQNVAIAAVQTK